MPQRKKYVDDNLSGKVDKVAEAVEDNIAVLDENGNIKDSGEKTSDFVRTLFEEVIIGKTGKEMSLPIRRK